jgi:hypothetical protein
MLRSHRYETRADRYRPSDPGALAREIRRLHREGLRVRDIAEALRMNDAEVAGLLAGDGAAA